jgi:curved DNA-binding protein CbpA
MSTKKIIEYRALYNSTKQTTLKELKTKYRNFMKDNHPDTLLDDVARATAEEKSKTIITAYHFLVSIAPETMEKDKAEYTKTITESNVADYHFEDTVLYVTFLDGNKYEYFGVPRSVYVKMVNAESPARFARRHIFSTYTYRSAMKLVGTEE